MTDQPGMRSQKVQEAGDGGRYPYPCPEAIAAAKEVCCWEGGSGITTYKFNPKVTFTSIIAIWTLIFSAIIAPEYLMKAMDEAALMWVSEVWIWFYLGSKNIWLMTIFWILITPRFASMKLGRETDEPEYTTGTWFAMLFAAGMAVGMFYFGVAEPIWHYKGQGGAAFIPENKLYGSMNENSIHAIAFTWYHWGIQGWSGFTTMGIILGMLVHRRGFPMAMRYTLYPLIKEKTHGIFGDIIDVVSIVSTICGVSTSLGVGVMALNSGFVRISHGFYRGSQFNIPSNETLYSAPSCGDQGQRCEQDQVPYGIQTSVDTKVIIVACVTCLATGSVVSGLNTGIVNLSRFTFALGCFILLTAFFLGEPYHTLNICTQAFGMWVWQLPKVMWTTNAYEGLGFHDLGLGGADDAKGEQGWMRGWTLFMAGWGTSWGPFVGSFIARVSKGRTLRSFICATMIAPTLYSWFWLGTWGSTGIRIQRIAETTGLCNLAHKKDVSLCQQEGTLRTKNCYLYANSYTTEQREALGLGFNPDCQLDPVYHGGFGRCREFLWHRRVEVGNDCVETTSWVHMPCNKEPQAKGGPGRCTLGGCEEGSPSVPDPTALAYPPVRGPCKGIIMMSEVDPMSSKRTFNWFYGAQPKCFVPVQDNIICLGDQPIAADMFFDVISSLGSKSFSEMISTIAVVAMVLFFVTSSDSGSYVVDMFASNGDEDPPTSQRIFWSITEGSCCAVLMYSGKSLPDATAGFSALQGSVVLTGLGYTVLTWFVVQSMILILREEAGDIDQYRKDWKRFLIDFSSPSKIFINIVAPGMTMGKIIGHLGGWPFSSYSARCSQMVFTFVFQGLYCLAWGLVCITGIWENWHKVGIVMYIGFSTFLAFLRNQCRIRCEIPRGDLITDMLCGWFVPFFTLAQMDRELFAPKDIDNVEMSEEAQLLTMYGLPRE